MKYKITSQECGRGAVSTYKFSTLSEASAFIQSYWQGPEYMSGVDGFHTDDRSFVLHGFQFRDIGDFVEPFEDREFRFRNDAFPESFEDLAEIEAHRPVCE
jgi:hypothetical protein